MIGIYAIENTINNRIYIGLTTVGFGSRWQQHIALLDKNRHHNNELQQAWNDHGLGALSFRILESIEDAAIIGDREAYWIRQFPNSCNLMPVSTKAEREALKKEESSRVTSEMLANCDLWRSMNAEWIAKYGDAYRRSPSLKTITLSGSPYRRFVVNGRQYIVPLDFELDE